jgi:hypothetical protein
MTIHDIARLCRSVAAAAMVATLAGAQSLPAFDGPFIYATGPQLFALSNHVADLDGNGTDDLVTRPGFPTVLRYRLSNPNGSLGQVFDQPCQMGTYFPYDSGDGTPEFVAFATASCSPGAVQGFLSSGRTCAQGPAGLGLTPFAIPMPCTGAGAHIHSAVVRGSSIVVGIAPVPGAVPFIQRLALQLPATPGGQPSVIPIGSSYFLAGSNLVANGVHLYPCGDLDGDGLEDLLVRETVAGSPITYEVVLVTPAGPMINTATPFISFPTPAPGIVYSADLTGDGLAELIFPDPASPQNMTVFMNQGAGAGGGVTLVPQSVPIGPAWPVGVADVDADGDVDVIGLDTTWQIRFLLNDGAGNLSLSPYSIAGDYSSTPTPGDYDGDGDTDILTVGAEIRVWLNRAVPAAIARPGTPDGLVLESAVHAAGVESPPLSGSPFHAFKLAKTREVIELTVAGAGTFWGSTAFLVGEPFPTGCAPPFFSPHVHVTGGSTTVILSTFTLLPPRKTRVTFALPSLPGPVANMSMTLQVVVLNLNAANGSYATTDAHEFQL